MHSRHINIFLSSTFRDMHAERDYIRKHVLPQLRNQLIVHGITVDMTDLRWGIDTSEDDEDAREAKVLHVCMEAIRKDRPYFVGILGNRYGWIPPERRVRSLIQSLAPEERVYFDSHHGCSVTEMEMVFGALADKDIFKHSYFFLRDESVYDEVPEHLKETYIETDPYRIEKLNALKENIYHAVNEYTDDNIVAFTYKPKWDDERKSFVALKEFGDALKNALLEDILETIDESEQMSEFEYEERMLETFVLEKLSSFCGREKLVNETLMHLTGFPANIKHNGLFLTGFSGCGKSSVFSKLYDLLSRTEDDGIVVLAHAVGVTSSSRNPGQMLVKWNTRLRNILGDSVGKEEYKDVVEEFSHLIITAYHRKLRPVILVDSYDSFIFPSYSTSSDAAIKDFSFIPKFVPFICTALPGYIDKIVDSHPTYKLIEVENYTYQEALELVHVVLTKGLKELPQDSLETLLSKKNDSGTYSYTSPLWLRISLSVLDELGNEDFVEINREQIAREDLKINVYIQRLVESFSATPEGIYRQYIQLSCSYFKPSLVKTAMTACLISSSGISTHEISQLCGDDWDDLEFESFAHWAKPFFCQNSLTGRWDLNHDILRKVLAEDEQAEIDALRSKYVEILKMTTASVESYNELLYQILAENDVEAYWEIKNSYNEVMPNCIEYGIRSLLEKQLSQNELENFIVTAVERCSQTRSLYDIYEIVKACTPSKGEVGVCLRLYDVLLRSLPDDCLYSGEKWAFEALTFIYSERFSIARDQRASDLCDRIYEEYMRVYQQNRKIYGNSFLSSLSVDMLIEMLCDYAHYPLLLRSSYPEESRDSLREEGIRRVVSVVGDIQVLLSAYMGDKRELVSRVLDRLEPCNNFYTETQLKKIVDALRLLEPSYDIVKESLHERDFGYWKECAEDSVRRREEASRAFEESLNKSKNAKESARTLNDFISKNLRNSYDDEISEYVKLSIRHAELLIDDGDRQEAMAMINRCAILATNHVVYFPEMYCNQHQHDYIFNNISGRLLDPVLELVYWLADGGDLDKAVRLLEEVFVKGMLLYAFSPFSDGARVLMQMLCNVYLNLGKADMAVSFMDVCHEFIFRSAMPRKDSHIHPDNESALYYTALRAAGQGDRIKTLADRIKTWPNFMYKDGIPYGKYSKIRVFEGDWSMAGVPSVSLNSCKWGYVDEQGNEVIRPMFDEATYFSNDRAMVGMGNPDMCSCYAVYGMKYGYIDRSGEIVIPLDFDYASAFYEGEALVSKNGSFYYIDLYGRKLRELQLFNL